MCSVCCVHVSAYVCVCVVCVRARECVLCVNVSVYVLWVGVGVCACVHICVRAFIRSVHAHVCLCMSVQVCTCESAILCAQLTRVFVCGRGVGVYTPTREYTA